MNPLAALDGASEGTGGELRACTGVEVAPCAEEHREHILAAGDDVPVPTPRFALLGTGE